MSENTEEQETRLTRHRKLQNGMELILGKLRHNAKSITTEDARSLADNAEDGDERTANIISAVEDIAIRNEAKQTDVSDDHPQSSSPSSQSILSVSQNVMERLRNDPSSITEEDARRFSENVEARDLSSARLVSAVESLAAAHDDIYGKNTNLEHKSHPSLLTVVKDLYAAVEVCPEDVNMEILKTTQSIVTKMQRAIGHTNAPHPELEAELQQEYAKIVPRVERGIVTKVEADHLHSLEARAHGHTERGGIAAIAQSVAAKRERQAPISSVSDNNRSRANSRTFTPPKQSQRTTGADLLRAELEKPRADDPTRRYQSLSDSTNTTRASIEDLRKQSSMNSRLAGLSVHDEGKKDTSKAGTTFHKHQTYDSGGMSSGGSENMLRAHKRENSQPTT